MPSTESSEPLSRILKSPLASFRIAAVVVAAIAMIFPAVGMSAFGEEVSVGILGMASWIAIFPTLLVLALISPGVPALGEYTKLLDIAAAAVGVISSLYLLFNMNTPFGPLGGEMGAGLGLGSYALFIATVISVFVAVPSKYLPAALRRN